MNLRVDPGFLGTNASMLSDLTLIAYILLLLPAMIAGYVFARRKMFAPQHKYVMTGITLFNWVLIGFVMFVSFRDGVAPAIPDGLSDIEVALPAIHLITGGIAQILATYLVSRMWLENVLPKSLLIKNIKTPMRLTLALWLITTVLGISIYFTWYTDTSSADSEAPIPAATEEAAPEDEATPDEPAATEEAEEAQEAEETEAATETPEAEEDVDAPASTEDAMDEPAATEDADETPEAPAATEEA